MTDVLAYLLEKGVRIKNAGASNIHTSCWWCGESEGKRGRLYINVDENADIPGLFMCLAGETSVLTWDGFRSIKELAGQTVRVMTEAGEWVEAPFKSFGEQKLYAVNLQRNGDLKTVFATEGHRWFIRRPFRERTTIDLRAGDRLAYSFGQGCKTSIPSPVGVQHGFVFGDGTRTPTGTCARLFGEKDEVLAPYFSNCQRFEYGNYAEYRGLPYAFKRWPDLNESRPYLYGWLVGYFAADGSVSKDGGSSIESTSRENLEFVEVLASRIGIGTYGIHAYDRVVTPPSGTTYNSRIYRLNFVNSTLSDSFFLGVEHLRRFQERGSTYDRKGWTIVSVEETGRFEEVYCATVERTHSFVLEGNILTGNCHICGERGSLRKIKRHFGDPVGDDETNGERRADVLNAAAAFYHEQLLQRVDVLDHLYNERGLTTDTIADHQLGFGGHGLHAHLVKQGFTLEEVKPTGLIVQSGTNIYEFLQDRIIIPYHAAGNVVQLRGRAYAKEERSKYVTPSGQKARMFNVDKVWMDPDQKKLEDIFITEGEFDCLILEQQGLTAVGVPGAKSWRENWVEYFTGFRRVFLCFDPDEAGMGGAEKIKEAIGPRAKTIEIPGGDVTDYVVVQQRPFEELIKVATGGLLLTVKDAFDEWDSVQGQVGFKFGIEPLDAFIQPGILPGQLVITLAKTGVGKTISALNFMTLAALHQPDAKFLFVSLEQTRGDWFERARRIHAFHNLSLVPRTLKDMPTFDRTLNSATMDFWGTRFAVVDKNRISEEELVACIADFEEQYGQKPTFTVVDYLGYYANSYRASDRYERVSDAVMGLKAVAKDQRIAIYAPHQLNRKAGHGDEPAVDDARDSGAIEETADFIFTLWSEDSRKGVEMGDRTGYVNLRIGKSRHGGKGALVKFRLGYLSLAMLPIEGAYAQSTQLLANEIGWQNAKVPWEMAMHRHVLGERL